jgi:peptidoglycan-N-acetylglucosamine deacetylase
MPEAAGRDNRTWKRRIPDFRAFCYLSKVKYFVKTPWLLKKIYSSYIWSLPPTENAIYFTFDDGPHPTITPFVLSKLKEYGALATFFCIGKNVVDHPDIYRQILDGGHRVGNHTHNHLNGWNTDSEIYLKDVSQASRYIESELFRPPYGKITLFQSRNLPAAMKGKKARVIMWDVLSADFDPSVTREQSLQFVVLRASAGSIVVFHDSEKAFQKLEYVLPRVLHHFSEKGFRFLSL